MDQENRLKPRSKEYQDIHHWVHKTLGKATQCSDNILHQANRYHWANISHQYKWEASDWKQLCPSCHKKYDGISEAFRQLKREQALGNTNRARPVLCYDLGRTWESAKEAGKELGLNYKAINNCLRGRCRTTAGFRWGYVGAS